MAVPFNVCLRRFKKNIQNPVMRRTVVRLMTGKLLGLVVVLALMQAFMPPVARASGQADDPTLEMNAINTAWTLIAAFLVFGMQVGFVMLEAGFARSREAVNILVEGIADTCICGRRQSH